MKWLTLKSSDEVTRTAFQELQKKEASGMSVAGGGDGSGGGGEV